MPRHSFRGAQTQGFELTDTEEQVFSFGPLAVGDYLQRVLLMATSNSTASVLNTRFGFFGSRPASEAIFLVKPAELFRPRDGGDNIRTHGSTNGMRLFPIQRVIEGGPDRFFSVHLEGQGTQIMRGYVSIEFG